ncbi:MAG: hypothetical protein ABIC95_06185 [archaeon]
MGYTRCHNCRKKVPIAGQCNMCGFINGLNRLPSDDEYVVARRVNEAHEYEQFNNIDMRVIELGR